MASWIKVSAPTRLHFGIVNPFIRKYRMYVSAGVAISNPRVTVLVKRQNGLSIRGVRTEELLEYLKGFAEKHGLNGYIEILESIPKHVGLGSTTQLLLATAYGLAIINDLDMSIEDIAEELGLGSISGVGIYVFKHGGFVVDTGKGGEGGIPKLLLRLDFPIEWRFIVLLPKGRGLDRAEERKVFETSVEIPENLVFKASFYLFHELATAVMDRDFQAFSRALMILQEIVGEMFKDFQGGVFADWCRDAVNLLKRSGVTGVGQSSWGPAVYGVVESEDEALRLVEKIRGSFDGSVFVAKPDNKGVLIEGFK